MTNGALRIRSNQRTEGTDGRRRDIDKEEGDDDDDDDDLKSRVQAVEEGSDEVSHMQSSGRSHKK